MYGFRNPRAPLNLIKECTNLYSGNFHSPKVYYIRSTRIRFKYIRTYIAVCIESISIYAYVCARNYNNL